MLSMHTVIWALAGISSLHLDKILEGHTFVPQAREIRVAATTETTLWVLNVVEAVMAQLGGAVAPSMPLMSSCHKSDREG
jgi:hypothetical protein